MTVLKLIKNSDQKRSGRLVWPVFQTGFASVQIYPGIFSIAHSGVSVKKPVIVTGDALGVT
jgi:hypothetical protein